MLSSMTGYGRGRARAGALSAEAEVRSVNGRFLSVRCRLPAQLLRLEAALESLVRDAVGRGSVDLHVRLETPPARRAEPRIDARVLASYRRALDRLGGGGDPALLLGLPGVVRPADEAQARPADVDAVVLDAAGRAVAALNRARRAEGRRLLAALRRLATSLERHLAAVRRRAPVALAERQAGTARRVAQLLQGAELSADDPGLRRELALLAERADITEELDRLDAHLAALRETLAGRGPAGRQLDFLLQEIGREINTAGAKSGDARLARSIVAAKAGVEALREQAANVE